MRYKCICSYDGSKFSGSQRQLNAVTVQGQIERGLKKIYNQAITIHLASRTDKGVHATAQVFHYDSAAAIDITKLKCVINRQMPPSIRITDVALVNDDFHARYDVSAKSYDYQLSIDPNYNVFESGYCYQYNKPLNLSAMRELASQLIGEHDYKAFMASGSDKQNTVRTLYDITIKQDANRVTISVSGNGFLYHMVRIIVGTLLDYSEGKKPLNHILNHFKNGNRQYFKRTAPACGLYLVNTRY